MPSVQPGFSIVPQARRPITPKRGHGYSDNDRTTAMAFLPPPIRPHLIQRSESRKARRTAACSPTLWASPTRRCNGATRIRNLLEAVDERRCSRHVGYWLRNWMARRTGQPTDRSLTVMKQSGHCRPCTPAFRHPLTALPKEIPRSPSSNCFIQNKFRFLEESPRPPTGVGTDLGWHCRHSRSLANRE
jgi:hypothetical protein